MPTGRAEHHDVRAEHRACAHTTAGVSQNMPASAGIESGQQAGKEAEWRAHRRNGESGSGPGVICEKTGVLLLSLNRSTCAESKRSTTVSMELQSAARTDTQSRGQNTALHPCACASTPKHAGVCMSCNRQHKAKDVPVAKGSSSRCRSPRWPPPRSSGASSCTKRCSGPPANNAPKTNRYWMRRQEQTRRHADTYGER